MYRPGVVLLTLACTACGGRVDGAGTTDDAGSLVDAGTAPTEIPVGDAGLICSVPAVSPLGDSAADDCTFSMTCTGGGASTLTVAGHCFEQGAFIGCYVNGNETNVFSKLEACDCASPAAFAPLAAPCGQ
jgi:hypothetical protein